MIRIIAVFIIFQYAFANPAVPIPIQVEFLGGRSVFSADETVTIVCVITTTSFSYSHDISWTKQQDEEQIEVMHSLRVLNSPFKEMSSKYSQQLTSPVDGDPQKMKTQFTITGVDSSDIGSYTCTFKDGVTNVVTSSSPVTLEVLSRDAKEFQLTTGAPCNPVCSFDDAHSVTCSASVENTEDITLKMFLNENEITQDFAVPNIATVWSGPVGLKTPLKSISIGGDAWQTPGFGSQQLRCEVSQGDAFWKLRSLDITRTPLASLRCESNYNRPIKVDDLDVIITCNVLNHNVDAKDVLEWKFFHYNGTVSMSTPEARYGRITEIENNTLRLKILRVLVEMIPKGMKDVAINVSLLQENGKLPIASAQVTLQLDLTRRITGGATLVSCSLFTMAASIAYALL